jgi:hypothetical protein
MCDKVIKNLSKHITVEKIYKKIVENFWGCSKKMDKNKMSKKNFQDELFCQKK